MGRAPCCDKANVKKGPWSPEEDAKLKSYIDKNGTGGNWIALPQKIGLKRCGKSCRLRWLNYLRPNIKHGAFSEEEDRIILSLYISIGSRWSIIAAQLPGRTDNDIKNYWNTRLKKKLLGKQIPYRVSTIKQELEKNFAKNNCFATIPIASEGSTTHSTTSWSEMNMLSNHMPMHNSTHLGNGTSVPYGTELDEMFQFNQVKLEGLEGLYGDMNAYNTTTSSESSLNWSSNEVSELMNPLMAPSILGMQQYCDVLDGQVHLGMQ
ncbi:hypothetical protein LUZ60_005045 [Juncus effusus]|nr:hypothetical protein LUZ60_005045 [Juncus effusus]